MAKLAAARGMLPLGPEETLEALRLLSGDEDEEVRTAVTGTLAGFDAGRLRPILDNPEAPSSILGFLAGWKGFPREVFQPLIFHRNVPDAALAVIASTTELGEVVELVSLKQQSLIQNPAIIDAILANPRRTPEAERRAREVREEFFEKEYGAQFIADEQRAQAEAAAPEAEPAPAERVVFLDDLSQFIEADLVDTGDELYEQFMQDFSTLVENLPEEGEVDEAELAFDIASLFDAEEFKEMREKEGFDERISVLARIATMGVKEKIRFAIKGTREVRMILIRDPNRPVCAAVIQNPRITDQEVETISALKSVNEEVLRLVGMNRSWTRNYVVIHNLVRNPKTPVALSLNFLNRIQSRDLRQLGMNKNVPEVIRTMAGRMYVKRQQG